jgi:hypothetical protein
MGFLDLPKKQQRRKMYKGGMVHVSVGKTDTCTVCGSNKFGKKIFVTHMGDKIKGKYCHNCGANKPGGVML